MYNNELKCNVKNLVYDFENNKGQLFLEGRDSVCDMAGCVELFKSIDHNVDIIELYHGNILYMVVKNAWDNGIDE